MKNLSRQTEESAARLAYVIGDDVHDYRRIYYNLSMLPLGEHCVLDSLKHWEVSTCHKRIGTKTDGRYRRLSIRRDRYARDSVRT